MPASAETIALPFSDEQNGTQLVLALLAFASSKGIDRVGDIVIETHAKLGNRWFACRTPIAFANHPTEDLPLVAHRVPTITKVTRLVIEREYKCRRYTEQRMAPGGTGGGGDWLLWTNENCRFRRVERYVARYPFQFASGYVPADWHHINAVYGSGDMKPLPPTCQPVAAVAAKAARHKIRARIAKFGEKTTVPSQTGRLDRFRPSPMSRKRFRLPSMAPPENQ